MEIIQNTVENMITKIFKEPTDDKEIGKCLNLFMTINHLKMM